MIKSQKQIKKHNNSVKLPQIKPKSGQGSCVNTRPSSSSKVQELHQKLFSKLGDIEDHTTNIKRKPSSVRSKKKINLNSTENGLKEINSELLNQADDNESKGIMTGNFDQLQKLMPQLYGKLKEMHKTENYQVQSELKPVTIEFKQKIESQTELSAPKPPMQTVQREKPNEQQNEIVSKPSKVEMPDPDEPRLDEMTELQMQEFYSKYSEEIGLIPETSNKELAEMNQNLINCERQMNLIEKGMVDILKTIGFQYPIPDSDCGDE